ncbi:MAG: gliding motility-associated C-terminal domain-containing protein, partial [Flavobacteriaceae bacterium]|nr:gliding motility-associated C-terminal domain-containing protein [Flavobacteriaceae bacterium]
WDVTGTQPAAPTGLECWETATFNDATCTWDVTGTQPAAPTGLECWETATFNDATCTWDVSISLTSDCDGDGVTDFDEFNDGTDNLDPCSFLSTSISLPVTAATDCIPTITATKLADFFGKEIGDTIDYTILVENTGNVVINDIYLVDVFSDINGNELILTQEPTFDESDLGSLEGTLLIGEIATYIASFTITQEAIYAGGVSNSVLVNGIGMNGEELVSDVSDDGDDFDGNTIDDPTITELGCTMVFNEFSPNGDGVNDFLIINCIDSYPDNKLEIYNRWGSMVYEQRSYANDFNGISRGRSVIEKDKELPVGTYYYVLNLGNGSEPKVGWLYINR